MSAGSRSLRLTSEAKMSKTNLTILDPVAYAEHLAEQNREATAELKALLEIQPIVTNSLPTTSPKTLPHWLSFAVVATVAAGFGLFAGVTLSGSLF